MLTLPRCTRHLDRDLPLRTQETETAEQDSAFSIVDHVLCSFDGRRHVWNIGPLISRFHRPRVHMHPGRRRQRELYRILHVPRSVAL